jgi:riboflavin synthase
VFTGLVQDVGRVVAVAGEQVRKLTVSTALPVSTFAVGESIAIDGVCLTVVDRQPSSFAVEAGAETLARTTVKDLAVGDPVHLERALALGDRLGGHLVLGHVDDVGHVSLSQAQKGGHALEVTVPTALLPFILEKGSITVDGVSLTVNSVRGDRIALFLIPETLRRTTLGGLEVGAAVNLETDILGKYVARLLGPMLRGQIEPERLANELALGVGMGIG